MFCHFHSLNKYVAIRAESQILKVSTDYILTGTQTKNDVDRLAGQIAQLDEDKRKMIEVLVAYCLKEL